MFSGPCLIFIATLTYIKVICVRDLLQSCHCFCPHTTFLAQKSPLHCFSFQQEVGEAEGLSKKKNFQNYFPFLNAKTRR